MIKIGPNRDKSFIEFKISGAFQHYQAAMVRLIIYAGLVLLIVCIGKIQAGIIILFNDIYFKKVILSPIPSIKT